LSLWGQHRSRKEEGEGGQLQAVEEARGDISLHFLIEPLDVERGLAATFVEVDDGNRTG